jgi:hypothetical protein
MATRRRQDPGRSGGAEHGQGHGVEAVALAGDGLERRTAAGRWGLASTAQRPGWCRCGGDGAAHVAIGGCRAGPPMCGPHLGPRRSRWRAGRAGRAGVVGRSWVLAQLRSSAIEVPVSGVVSLATLLAALTGGQCSVSVRSRWRRRYSSRSISPAAWRRRRTSSVVSPWWRAWGLADRLFRRRRTQAMLPWQDRAASGPS